MSIKPTPAPPLSGPLGSMSIQAPALMPSASPAQAGAFAQSQSAQPDARTANQTQGLDPNLVRALGTAPAGLAAPSVGGLGQKMNGALQRFINMGGNPVEKPRRSAATSWTCRPR